MDLKSDPKRAKYAETGIPIRALNSTTKQWDSIDLNHLDRESVLEWMRGRTPRYLKAIVCALLRHEAPSDAEEAQPDVLAPAPATPPVRATEVQQQQVGTPAPALPPKCVCTATGRDPATNPAPDCMLHSIGPAGEAYRARTQGGTPKP